MSEQNSDLQNPTKRRAAMQAYRRLLRQAGAQALGGGTSPSSASARAQENLLTRVRELGDALGISRGNSRSR